TEQHKSALGRCAKSEPPSNPTMMQSGTRPRQRSTFQQPKLDGASSISRPSGRCAPSEPPSNPTMMWR
ncbi:MAG: hypothetical protein II677_01065, partial [Muribaculaceae bacterium]|nr:hypothetical protein [Muribaculaceae bacterium]